MDISSSRYSSAKSIPIPSLEWLNPLKAFALIAILLNHLVEEFSKGPWFTNPSNHWPDFSSRMANIVPDGFPHPLAILQFLGWLGDSAPGVFILVSGIGLTWSALHRPEKKMQVGNFYLRRIRRIYPLYITMHFIFLAGAVFVPAHLVRKVSQFSYSLDSPYTLMSLLGLRCTDNLFFGFISPSWWFIWLIVQLYLVFPLLFILLQRRGINQFLMLTCGFTFAVRLFGICYPQLLPYSLFDWMTGIFFGTRLAEFSVGMAIAVLLKDKNLLKVPVGKLFSLSTPIYIVGVASSLTWPGTVVSNLLVTLGMSGLFYSLWELVVKKISIIKSIILWIGVYSYGVYLFHQPPLKMTAILNLSLPYHVAAAIVMIVLSFPTAWLIKRGMSLLMEVTRKTIEQHSLGKLSSISILVSASIMLALDMTSGWQHRLIALVAGLQLIFLFFLEYYPFHRIKSVRLSWLRWLVICALFIKLFFFPSLLGTLISLLLGLIIAILSLIFRQVGISRNLARGVSVLAVFFCLVGSELLLLYFAPLSVGKWGELPALQIHPTRIYGLKPSSVTHLKYNNYDYVVRTNSLGLASPEIALQRPSPDTQRILIIGDAFSMPEGLEYQDSYPALLEKKIAAEVPTSKVQVINGGVTGYGPVEEYHQLKELGPLLKPDVVIYQFFVNEFSEVNVTAQGRLRGIGLDSGSSTGRIDLIDSSQLIRHAGELLYSMVDAVIRNYGDSSPFIEDMSLKVYRFLEKLTGRWRYRNAQLQFYQTGENSRYDKERLDKLRYYLGAMQQICTEINSEFMVYFVPAAVTVSKREDMKTYPLDQDISDKSIFDFGLPFIHLKKIADSLSIEVVDLTPQLKSHPVQPVYFPASWHWNKEGHQVAADVIARDLINKGFINGKQ